MQVNGCPGKANATENYEVPGLDSLVGPGGGSATSPLECRSIATSCTPHENNDCTGSVSCSASSPMVMCYHGDSDDDLGPDVYTVANLSFARFFGSFFAP